MVKKNVGASASFLANCLGLTPDNFPWHRTPTHGTYTLVR
jgi:hypothetical protein